MAYPQPHYHAPRLLQSLQTPCHLPRASPINLEPGTVLERVQALQSVLVFHWKEAKCMHLDGCAAHPARSSGVIVTAQAPAACGQGSPSLPVVVTLVLLKHLNLQVWPVLAKLPHSVVQHVETREVTTVSLRLPEAQKALHIEIPK